MNITVKKATEAEKAKMLKKTVWTCGISEFDRFYESEEICPLVEGQAAVLYAGGSVSSGAGDCVTFPQGSACVWKVTAPVKKHSIFK